MDDGFFGGLFDFDGDGKLDSFEKTLDFLAFVDLISDDEKNNSTSVFDYDNDI